jgi:transcriptional regulator with XRE-family HTH domain
MNKPPEQSDIARQARELRRERRFTQADLSRLTGVAKSDISRFESGRAAPTTRTIDRIAKALGARLVLVPHEGPPDLGGQGPATQEGGP